MTERSVPDAAEAMEANRRHWDEVVPVHVASEFYDVASFKAGRSTLKPVEVEELGDVRGKTLLHLQCHFGMDTLSWAREGRPSRGLTTLKRRSPRPGHWRHLAASTPASRCRTSTISHRISMCNSTVVFTSYGVLCWLPDLARWAQVAADFVRPGGTFYIVEFHPFQQIFDDDAGVGELRVRFPYFREGGALMFDDGIDYADPTANVENRATYLFPYPLSYVVTSLIEAGLRIEFLHEFPFSTYQFLPYTEKRPDGTVRLKQHDGCVPLLFSIKATKPA